jgi:hypothetical protein
MTCIHTVWNSLFRHPVSKTLRIATFIPASVLLGPVDVAMDSDGMQGFVTHGVAVFVNNGLCRR